MVFPIIVCHNTGSLAHPVLDHARDILPMDHMVYKYLQCGLGAKYGTVHLVTSNQKKLFNM